MIVRVDDAAAPGSPLLPGEGLGVRASADSLCHDQPRTPERGVDGDTLARPEDRPPSPGGRGDKARAAVDALVPRRSARVWRVFAWYGRWYLRRHFHGVRMLGAGPALPDDRPAVVYLNHPSWWDPMVGVLAADRLLGTREHFAPIEAAALAKYRFFEKLGFFGIDPTTAAGARTFLRRGGAILSRGGRTLWVTAEGTFTDPRRRPVALRPGVAHLAARLQDAVIVPLAIEYPFWSERLPEALLHFGPVMELADRRRSPRRWHGLLERQLQHTMDTLAAAALSRDPGRFTTLLDGGAGVSIVYDAWRRLRAAARGERFTPAHLDDGQPRGHA